MSLLILLAIALAVGITVMAFKYGGAERILIGTIILVVLGYLNPQTLGMLLLGGIVCTAGLGLVPFFFVAWIIGSAVRLIIDGVRGTRQKPAVARASVAIGQAGERDSKSLANYISQARTAGMSNPDIKQKLQKQGWSDQEINSALK